ncbi:hypothetical protein KKA33_01685, partial [Patescibacteria group bacterium]|nr:hypothetical protein [Patescibacteria group bacterium]
RQAYGDDDIRHNVGLGSWTPRAFATFGHKSRKKDSNTEKDAVGAVRRPEKTAGRYELDDFYIP